MSDAQLIHHGRGRIHRAPKTLALAALFFSEKERTGAWVLHAWGRYCDGQIAQARDTEDARHRLLKLREQTLLAHANIQVMESDEFEGLRLLFQSSKMPVQYPLDLLRGLQMDLDGATGKSEDELLDYCYCVSGVVGLMMCHVLDVRDEQALIHAVDLGQALRLTRISRDIDVDLHLGRVHIPREWLARDGLSPEDLKSAWTRPLWPRYSKQLFELAEEKYDSGRQGLSYLPFRAAWLVGIMAGVSRAVGTKVLDRGSRAWDHRCSTSVIEKAWIVFQETLFISVQFLPHLARRWQTSLAALRRRP